MEFIFEKSKKGMQGMRLRPLAVKAHKLNKKFLRDGLALPEVSEAVMVRHYTNLSRRAFGVDNGFYPLGSCTMKYSPKLNEEAASLPGFATVHPLQDEKTVQGSLEALFTLSAMLNEITGMDATTLQPAAGAHGEHAALLMINAYHRSRGDVGRNKVIVPDSAHGTNPATVTMAGFSTINVKSDAEGGVDLDELRRAVGSDTAAIMLTNPTTLGLFEKNIEQIAEIVHDAGGLLYYDGANLNPIMGITRPGDMGFDIIHLNLHKTFSTPHGGGGPGSGPVGCKAFLAPYLPNPTVVKTANGYRFNNDKNSIGKVSFFYGNFSVCLKALTYVLTLGAGGIKEAAEYCVLSANYLKSHLQDLFPTQKDRYCMHEFVLSAQELKEKTGIAAVDIAKGLIDRGIHPPTTYFPLIVPEALMIEPTETEDKATLDNFIAVMRELHALAYSDPDQIKDAPRNAPISRPDDVRAARSPIFKAPLQS